VQQVVRWNSACRCTYRLHGAVSQKMAAFMKILRFTISQIHSSLVRLHCQLLPCTILLRLRGPLASFNHFSYQVSISGGFQHLSQPGPVSLSLLHPRSRFAVVFTSSFALLRSISMHLVVIGDLPFDKQVYTTSAVFRLPNVAGFLFSSSISSVIISLRRVS
jgi:hypothetical protein